MGMQLVTETAASASWRSEFFTARCRHRSPHSFP